MTVLRSIDDPRPSGGKALRTYGRLVAATLSEINETGGFGAETVATRAGTSVATFYVYLPSKAHALNAAFEAAMDGLVEQVHRDWDIERLLTDGLSSVCENAVRNASLFFDQHAMIFRLAIARLSESKDIRDIFRDHEAKVIDRYEHFIRLGQSAGKLRSNDISTMAKALLILMQGMNNPHLIASKDDGDLMREMATAIHAHLEPKP